MYWEWSGNYLHSKWDGACSIEDECCVTLAKGGPESGLIAEKANASRATLWARFGPELSSILSTTTAPPILRGEPAGGR